MHYSFIENIITFKTLSNAIINVQRAIHQEIIPGNVKRSLKLAMVMLEKTGTVNVISRVLKWMALLTVSSNNPWQLKLKSISLLNCFAVHPLQQRFGRVWLSSSWGCWHLKNFCKEAFPFCSFYNQTHGKLHGICKQMWEK